MAFPSLHVCLDSLLNHVPILLVHSSALLRVQNLNLFRTWICPFFPPLIKIFYGLMMFVDADEWVPVRRKHWSSSVWGKLADLLSFLMNVFWILLVTIALSVHFVSQLFLVSQSCKQKLSNLVILLCALQGKGLLKLISLYELRSLLIRKQLGDEVTRRAGMLQQGSTKSNHVHKGNVLDGAVWGRMGIDQLGTESIS